MKCILLPSQITCKTVATFQALKGIELNLSLDGHPINGTRKPQHLPNPKFPYTVSVMQNGYDV